MNKSDQFVRIRTRLQEIREGCKDGWLNGEGVAPSEQALAGAEEVLCMLVRKHYDVIPPVHIYPCGDEDGGIEAAWTLPGRTWLADAVFAQAGDYIRLTAVRREGDDVRELVLDRAAGAEANAKGIADLLLVLAHEEEQRSRLMAVVNSKGAT